ncbi:hypothetical protein MRX96_005352 [Rhipicephalus microplus]
MAAAVHLGTAEAEHVFRCRGSPKHSPSRLGAVIPREYMRILALLAKVVNKCTRFSSGRHSLKILKAKREHDLVRRKVWALLAEQNRGPQRQCCSEGIMRTCARVVAQRGRRTAEGIGPCAKAQPPSRSKRNNNLAAAGASPRKALPIRPPADEWLQGRKPGCAPDL